MGTRCEICFFGGEADAAIEAAVAEVYRIERKYSRYLPASDLSHLNRIGAVGGSIEVDQETAVLLDYAGRCNALSDGLFDVTAGVLRRVWNFRSQEPPDLQLLAETLPLIGWRKLVWSNPVLSFPRPGMELDFGGLAKEYAVDRAVAVCRDHGVAAALVDLGGDIGIVGPQPDGTPWQIGIRDPSAPQRSFAIVALSQGAVASSGDYERYIVLDGRRYSHILDPRTGWPLAETSAVSVASERCLAAGSFSTIAMLKGANGSAWLERLGVAYAVVERSGARAAVPPFVLKAVTPPC